MKNYSVFLFFLILISSCSYKHQIIYLNDIEKEEADSWSNISFLNNIETGDILKIDIKTVVPEASIPYNKSMPFDSKNYNIELLKLEGYLVDDLLMINFPVLGKISVDKLNEKQLEDKITSLLAKGNHLTNANVSVRRINNKFTVLGEVKNPGTFSHFEKNLNILQAIGYAGDLTIDAKRKDITLIRQEKGNKRVYKVDLTKSKFFKSSAYDIKNNDIIIINPNFSKVKSAGFIGNPSSVASIASILLSITLLITNN
tara:strand:+ start:320 stop:1090 length:771 start_codon:yes stop_codon:yes gene_type:complete